MEKNVELSITGLKCDNPKCDWKDDTITFESYKEWINKPCPKCGDNVLTPDDFLRTEAIIKTTEILNKMSPEELNLLKEMFPVDFEALKNNPMYKNTEGLDKIQKDDVVKMSLETHKEITVTKIEKVD